MVFCFLCLIYSVSFSVFRCFSFSTCCLRNFKVKQFSSSEAVIFDSFSGLIGNSETRHPLDIKQAHLNWLSSYALKCPTINNIGGQARCF